MRDLRRGSPRGTQRISSAVGFGRRVVAPLLHEFRAKYPDVDVDLLLNDKPTGGWMQDGQIIVKQLIGHFFRYLGRQHLPSRIRDFVDFMTAQIRARTSTASTISRRLVRAGRPDHLIGDRPATR